jgi:hypothetical protein
MNQQTLLERVKAPAIDFLQTGYEPARLYVKQVIEDYEREETGKTVFADELDETLVNIYNEALDGNLNAKNDYLCQVRIFMDEISTIQKIKSKSVEVDHCYIRENAVQYLSFDNPYGLRSIFNCLLSELKYVKNYQFDLIYELSHILEAVKKGKGTVVVAFRENGVDGLGFVRGDFERTVKKYLVEIETVTNENDTYFEDVKVTLYEMTED